MSIADSLLILDEVARQHHLSHPYVVGGMPRNIILARQSADTIETKDVDITTGNEDAFKLAREFAERVGGDLVKIEDNHFEVVYRKKVYDFSKNIKNPQVDQFLTSRGVEKPSDIQRDIFSRDFTINTILMSLDFSKVYDLTGKGLDDLKTRTLRCPLDPVDTLSFDPKRILRAYYFAAKYKCVFSEELKNAIPDVVSLLDKIHRRYSAEMINKVLRADETLLGALIDDGVLQRVPMTKYVKSLLIKNRRLLEIL